MTPYNAFHPSVNQATHKATSNQPTPQVHSVEAGWLKSYCFCNQRYQIKHCSRRVSDAHNRLPHFGGTWHFAFLPSTCWEVLHPTIPTCQGHHNTRPTRGGCSKAFCPRHKHSKGSAQRLFAYSTKNFRGGGAQRLFA